MKTTFLSLLTLLFFAHLSSPAEAMWNGDDAQEASPIATLAPKVRILFPSVTESFADNEALIAALSSGRLSSALEAGMEAYRSQEERDGSYLSEMAGVIESLRALLPAQVAAALGELALGDGEVAADAGDRPASAGRSHVRHTSLASMEEAASGDEEEEAEEGDESDYEDTTGLARMPSQMPTVGDSAGEEEEEAVEGGEETQAGAAEEMPPLMRTLSQMPEGDGSGDVADGAEEAEHGSSPLSPTRQPGVVFGPLRAPATDSEGVAGDGDGNTE